MASGRARGNMIVMRASHRTAIALILLLGVLTPATGGADQATFARAKDLYASAAYDEALALLQQLKPTASPPERIEIAGYKVFCLLALGRSEDAQEEIESILKTDPRYRPSETLASPRVRAVFDDVRARLLPEIVQETYAAAKAAFDRKDLPVARKEFERVLLLLDDPALVDQPGMADLRTLATGFRDLSGALAENEDVPAPPRPLPPPVTPILPRTYDATDANVIRPAILSQPMPEWRPRSAIEGQQEHRGTLELIIDENGRVASVVLRESVHGMYDARLLEAARRWKFRPAMKEGLPVKYRELMIVRLRPAS